MRSTSKADHQGLVSTHTQTTIHLRMLEINILPKDSLRIKVDVALVDSKIIPVKGPPCRVSRQTNPPFIRTTITTLLRATRLINKAQHKQDTKTPRTGVAFVVIISTDQIDGRPVLGQVQLLPSLLRPLDEEEADLPPSLVTSHGPHLRVLVVVVKLLKLPASRLHLYTRKLKLRPNRPYQR